ncbi:MFS transporter [Aurantiacibacter suaedae]|uniref:MFS transporter n=1 Tax=Aurantiacibacter suaedae TaxID=2545755 RepID=UPI0010F9C506|nr:MFS transporter [Aurantiacibacter suaedae]
MVAGLTSERVRPFSGWRVLAALWLLMILNEALPLITLTNLAPYITEEFALPRSQVGLIFAFYSLALGLSGPFCAYFIARIGVRWTLVIGNIVLLCAALAITTLQTGSALLLPILVLLIGISAAFGSAIPGQTAVTRWFVRHRSWAIAIFLAGGTVGGLISPHIIRLVVEAEGAGWRAGWMVVAAAAAVAIFVAIFLVIDDPEKVGQTPDGGREADASPDIAAAPWESEWTLRTAFCNPAMWAVLIAGFGFIVIYHTFNSHGALHIRDLGFSQSMVATCFSVAIAAGFSGQMLAGWVGQKISPRLIWAIALIAEAAGIVLFSWATSAATLLLAVALIGGGGATSMVSMITTIGNWFGRIIYPAIYGTVNAILSIAGALAPILAGTWFDVAGSYRMVFYAFAIICLIGALVIFRVSRPEPPSKRKTIGEGQE